MADPKKARRGVKTRMSTAAFADKMRVEAIAKRLEKNALGELKWSDGEHKGKPYYMNESELRAAESVLSRAIPKLTSQAITGADGEGPAVVVLMKDGKGK